LETTLLNLGKSIFVASAVRTSTFEISKSEILFSKIAAIFWSCSIAITLPALSARGIVRVPIPAPISKIVSFLDKFA
jgi:hypothetical protein